MYIFTGKMNVTFFSKVKKMLKSFDIDRRTNLEATNSTDMISSDIEVDVFFNSGRK